MAAPFRRCREQLFESALTASLGTDSTGTGNGIINWHFADLPVYVADFIPKGETVTLTYTVTVTDAQGATSEQTITVVIGGTDACGRGLDSYHGRRATTICGRPAQNWETGTAPVADRRRHHHHRPVASPDAVLSGD